MGFSLEAAFERAGVSRAKIEAATAALKFIEQGGTREDWGESYDLAVKAMPGEGQKEPASDGRRLRADARQPNTGGSGHSSIGQQQTQGDRAAPAGEPLASGGGRSMSGPQAQPARASVAREPSAAQLRADATFAKTEGKVLTAFNTRKTNDGRPWAKVRWYELKSLQRDGGLAREIERMIGPLSPRNQDKELGELMTPEQFDLALTRTEHRNDAD